MRKDVKSYFEIHAHNYLKTPEFYSSVVDQIKRIMPKNRQVNFLDVGCGNGNLVKALISAGLKLEYYLTDISQSMIKLAKENLANSNAKFFVADSFNMPIEQNTKFDVIHIDSVLHHLIGITIGKSINLIKKMIELLTNKLSSNGILIVEEVFYNSHIIPRFTSALIFYGLKFCKFLNLDFSRLVKEFNPGLEVNFLHEKQLPKLLSQFGHTYLLHKGCWHMPRLYKFFLLEQIGHVTYVLKKQ